MSEDKIRSDFEAWYCKKFTFENMARKTDGTYRGEHAFNSWVSWQAALSQSKPEVSQPAPVYKPVIPAYKNTGVPFSFKLENYITNQRSEIEAYWKALDEFNGVKA